ncbi:MAG: hypothetical protein K8S13_22355 [Desulfobacula sp.]|uniref:hypothetical protein n=1 Tax=Desulfobacula sp. TaxID=2593537 RepID=UPI0025C13F2F|nr:hypothetical protein [Desulfobacula sp.]MCD4722573.1 hypothetical protein [Desulfobacula sp.]
MGNMVKYIFIGFFCMLFFVACEKTKHKELVLYDFESEFVFDQFHWKCRTLFSLSDKYAVHGEKSLKLELFPSSYPGLSPSLKHHDWREYQTLCFEVYNPAPDMVKLVLRIDDKKKALEYSDRYNKSFMIIPGANTLNIPLDSLKTSKINRPLELKNIYRFLIFMSHPDKRHVLYLDYFRLIPINPV